MQTINPKEVLEKYNNPFILDVRTPVEYREVHAPGSVLMPLHKLDPHRVKELAGDSPCFVMCRSGNRARTAAEKLIAAGIKNVQVIEGGILGWDQCGMPVNRGKKTLSIERQVRIGAGLMIVVSAALAQFVNPLFDLITVFVGIGLIIAGVTNWCGMALILARMPWNNNVQLEGASCSR